MLAQSLLDIYRILAIGTNCDQALAYTESLYVMSACHGLNYQNPLPIITGNNHETNTGFNKYIIYK